MDFSVKIEGLDKIQNATKAVQQSVAEELRKGLLASAKHVEAKAKKSIASGGKTGRIYNRRKSGGFIGSAVSFSSGRAEKEGSFRDGYHRASAPGEAPASDTGRLINSINASMDSTQADSAIVVAGSGIVKYAAMLEFGTTKIAARPFFFPALENSKAWIRKRLAKAVRIAAAKSVGK
jgi:HK97 gp10 family phage protein